MKTIGHECRGGGAQIIDSPIFVHIHIHGASEPLIGRVGRIVNALIGRRSIVIEGANQLTEQQLSRGIVRQLTDG